LLTTTCIGLKLIDDAIAIEVAGVLRIDSWGEEEDDGS
jgi:hypothetical protein